MIAGLMKYSGKLFFICIIIISTSHLKSQNLRFTNYTTKDGLSSNKVNSILQDKNGFIWIATEDGLNRYDGYEFKVFRNNPEDTLSLSDNNIWELFEDKSGDIWIGTNSGYLDRYDQKKNEFYKWLIKPEGKKEAEITAIFQDKNDEIWIGTYKDGLYKLNIVTNKIEHWFYDPDDSGSLSNNFVTSIVKDSHGYLWISTYNGLNRFNPNSDDDSFQQFYSEQGKENSLSSNLIWLVSKSALNPALMWVGTADGLVSLDIKKKTFTRISIPKELTLQFGNSVASVVEEKINNGIQLWIGTYGGLVKLNLGNDESQRFIKTENDPSSIISNKINKVIKDRSGVIWIATENGLSKISEKSQRFNNIFSDETNQKLFHELFGKSVKSIVKDMSGNIYFGTENGVVSFRQGKLNTILKYPQTTGLNVWSLIPDLEGNLWVGTYGQGLNFFNLNSGWIENIKIESPTFKTSAYDYVKSLELNGENLLIGFWGGGLAEMNVKTRKYKIWINDVNNPFSISYNDVWSILNDRNNRTWVGTNGGGLNLAYRQAGLFSDPGEYKFYNLNSRDDKKNKLNSMSIYVLYESRSKKIQTGAEQDILWVGTSSGLSKVVIKNYTGDNNYSAIKFETTNYSPENDLTDNSVKNIIEDKNGNLWLSTSSGITFFDVEKETFTSYSDADGLIGNEFNSGSSLISNEGTMYFGTINGINFFRPEQISPSSFNPQVLITEFQIFNQPVKNYINKTGSLNLTFSQNVFSFQLSALDFNFPPAIQYAYKMEGFDKDWIYSGNRRFITYTNLGSGNYTFKYKATNCDGVWNKNYNSIVVNISPPWWRTTWSYIIYVLLILSGVFVLRRFELNRSKLRNELKMREFEAKKQHELEIMKSRFFTNLSHEFRTPLTLIRGPVEELLKGNLKDDPEEYYQLIYRNSKKLQLLIDQLLELTRLENAAIPLKAKKEDLVKLVHGLSSSFESLAKQKNINLVFTSEVESVICWIDRDKLEKIINNLLSNALKFTSENGRVSVQIKCDKSKKENYSSIIISDTGIGIAPEKLKRIFDRFYQADDSSNRKYGGSGIGLALVKELVDLHKWKISVQSIERGGTEFTLMIPLDGSYLDESGKIIEEDQNRQGDEIFETKKETEEQIELSEKEIEKEILEKNKLLSSNPMILIVEDSEDVRSYLKSLLKNEYRLSEAINGEDGLNKSEDLLPDLIISDIMMPSMDGIEFCKSVKTNLQTSHIPVILLTAKASPESKIEGLETGADDYLTKPFSSKELLIRIKNLLEQRKNLREKFAKEIKIDLSSVAVTSLDDEFLRKAFDVAEKNLSNSEFNSEEYAREMFLSRSQFHRKLIAVTSQGPGEFLRTFRLKKAASLLVEKRLNITQIAFEVGFSSPSHFTKAFRQFFNCLPTEFIEKNNS